MQPAVDVVAPEIEEALQLRIARRQVQLLPQEGLQQPRVIGQVVQDLRRGQAVALQLTFEIGHPFTSFQRGRPFLIVRSMKEM